MLQNRTKSGKWTFEICIHFSRVRRLQVEHQIGGSGKTLKPGNKPVRLKSSAAVTHFLQTMWMYPVVFLAAMGVDLIPVFAPPAWTLMVFFLVKFNLNAWSVLLAGVPGSALGRYLFSLYIPKVSAKLITRRKDQELEFVGKKLAQTRWKTWTFVFLYTLTPLSTTALFTAAGMAKIHPMQTVPPFFVGKLLSDGLMIAMGHHLSSNPGDFLHSLLSAKGILTMLFGLVVIGGLLFIDWRSLLQKKKLKFDFKIWK